MKKKIIILLLAVIFLFFTPYIKLWIYSNHYEMIGSYIIFDKDKQLYGKELDSPKHLNIISNNTVNSIKITSILYYDELKQISFGVISDSNTLKHMELKILDKDGNAVGELLTQGTINFYNKSLEKLHLILFESLNMNDQYTILISDKKNNKIGEIVFIK